MHTLCQRISLSSASQYGFTCLTAWTEFISQCGSKTDTTWVAHLHTVARILWHNMRRTFSPKCDAHCLHHAMPSLATTLRFPSCPPKPDTQYALHMAQPGLCILALPDAAHPNSIMQLKPPHCAQPFHSSMSMLNPMLIWLERGTPKQCEHHQSLLKLAQA